MLACKEISKLETMACIEFFEHPWVKLGFSYACGFFEKKISELTGMIVTVSREC